MITVDVPATKGIVPICSCIKCGRTMQVRNIKPHARKNCPVWRFLEFAKLPGESRATDAQRVAIRELYDAKVPLPMPPELAEALESASREAATRLISWLLCQKPSPGKPDAPRTYLSDNRVECPRCGATLNRHYLGEHMQKTCLGSREAREAQAVQQAHKRKHRCPECGRAMARGSATSRSTAQ